MPKVGRVLRNAPPQNGRLGPSHPTGQESHPYLKFSSYEITSVNQPKRCNFEIASDLS